MPMEEVRKALAPLTDWIPPDLRGLVQVEVWWMLLLVAGLAVLLLAGHLVRALWRALFRRRRRPRKDWDRDLREDLDECPLPVRPPGERVLTAYHLPVRLRLVVVAPGSKEVEVDATAVERLLERLVPGLGEVAAHDRPLIRVWPAQLSQQGFINSFHRCTVRREPEGEPSRWVLLAGRTPGARPFILLGLGLWADEPNTFGRINLEPHQWLDVLRLRPAEKRQGP
jgi:hypothetical protein